MNDPRAFWDQRFGEPGFAYGEAPNDFLRQVAERIPAGPVLCLAEGEGRNAVFLAERGHDVLAVDISAVGLEKAQRFAASRGVSIRTEVADLSSFAIEPGVWSGIVAIWMHLPPALRARVHSDAVRGLRPGGALVIEAYRPEQLERGTGGPRERAMLVDPDDLRREIAGIEIERFDTATREVHEGPYHDGISATVQVLAFRR